MPALQGHLARGQLVMVAACGLCNGSYEAKNLGAHMRSQHGVSGHARGRSPERIASALLLADPVGVERILTAVREDRPIGRPHPDDRLAALVTALLHHDRPMAHRFGVNGQTIIHIQRLIADGTITPEGVLVLEPQGASA